QGRVVLEGPRGDDAKDWRDTAALRAGYEVVLFGRRRHPGLSGPEAVRREVRRVPEEARDGTDGHGGYSLLRGARSKGPLYRGLSLGQTEERPAGEPRTSRSWRVRRSHQARIRRWRSGRLDARLRAILSDAPQPRRTRRHAHPQARDGEAHDRQPHRRVER